MRVVSAEDLFLLRDGLTRLLEAHGCDVVAGVETGPALLDAIAEHNPDVAVVDLRLPPTFTERGVASGATSPAGPPGFPVLVLSQYVEQLYARTARRWFGRSEREVLSLMAEGCSNAAIAERLVVSERAVAKHTASIFMKLDLAPSGDDNRRVLAVLMYLGR